MKTPVRLKEIIGKTVVGTLEVPGGHILFFDDTYLSVYAVTGWDSTELSDEPVDYDAETKRAFGLT